MSVQTLRSYFETPDRQQEALGGYFEAWGGVVSLSKEMLDHYDASQRAYDPLASADEAFRDFTKIYDELRGPNWQVFRPYSPKRDCWPPKQIFETIKREFGTFSWGGQVNLLNFSKSGTRDRFQSCLKEMRGIKPNRGYPHMTVSKFLHFYNPGLFPIYDNKMIWEKVFKDFDDDFQDFCGSADIPYKKAINDDTETFLLYYMDWANYLLSVAHPAFMQVFINWLGGQPDSRLKGRSFDPASLYATAFEITAIGATWKASQKPNQDSMPGPAPSMTVQATDIK